jgi:hypothetical protein
VGCILAEIADIITWKTNKYPLKASINGYL